jgi:hypothetical protein
VFSQYKLSKERFKVMCCGKASGKLRLKRVVSEKPKEHDCSRVPMHLCLLLQPERSMDGQGEFLKFYPQAFCSRSSGYPERDRITTESTIVARRCPFSSKREHTDFQR